MPGWRVEAKFDRIERWSAVSSMIILRCEFVTSIHSSLVALSLILSLLQFKPAPMYILDEIDAALDLSHTQNIGHLFRTRFKGSQFIVVSLKEGMFNNANVLFKARFRDGTSVVERFTQRQSSSTAIAEPLKGRNASNSTLSDKENALATNSGASKRSRRV